MKKIIVPAITLILGLVAGYFISKQQQHPLVDDEKQAIIKRFIDSNKVTFESVDKGSGVITDLDSIKNMKQEYINEGGGLIFGPDGKTTLRGYYIEKDVLNAIFAKNSKYTGISLYLGKHPKYLGQSKRIYTLMFMGATLNPTGSAFHHTDDFANGIYDHVSICPDECGTFVQ